MDDSDGCKGSGGLRGRIGRFLLFLACLAAPGTLADDVAPAVPLLVVDESVVPPRRNVDAISVRGVRMDDAALGASIEGRVTSLSLILFGRNVVVDREQVRRNRSGSTSWVGHIRGATHDRVVLVKRDGITVGSIRTGRSLYLLFYAGRQADGGHGHVLYEVDESSARFVESEPTPVRLSESVRVDADARAEAMRQGVLASDDGSMQDLLVVYTQRAVDDAGGLVALENLIDLGVTETNLSYEASGIAHRLRLVHTALTDFDELAALGDPRDLIQDPDDGIMDEVHALRDAHAADLVKLVLSGNGCGRAFIMAEVSLAFEAFAFCWTDYFCITPGYTFQHELGHIQAGRHQWDGDATNNAPFTFNHGYIDAVNGFRTIMAGNDIVTCPECSRRLAWANPDVLDPRTGVPMGIPEGEPLAADNRKTLNATAWTVANFRVSQDGLFDDGFESGDASAWTSVVPGAEAASK